MGNTRPNVAFCIAQIGRSWPSGDCCQGQASQDSVNAARECMRLRLTCPSVESLDSIVQSQSPEAGRQQMDERLQDRRQAFGPL